MTLLERRLVALKPKVLRALRVKDADFSLSLLSNREMNKVRRTLMKRRDFKGPEARKIAREKMVNVLSFPEPADFPHPENRKRSLGEVFLNLDYEREEPGALPRLLVHGVLHLLGYRHDSLRDTIKMQALEKKLYRALKISHHEFPLHPRT